MHGLIIDEKTASESKLSVFTVEVVTSGVTWGFVLGSVLLNRPVKKLRKEKSKITTFAK